MMQRSKPKKTELCQICGRPVNLHTPDQIAKCSKKMKEFKKQKKGGAGIG